jgi:uncharacterized protein YrrD
MQVIAESTQEIPGRISDVLIDPDTGKIEGFFCDGHRFFLASHDIARFSAVITIARADLVGPVDDLIRLKALLADPRTILGQKIRTQDGKFLGRCADIQFDTKTFRMEWIWPRKYFRWGIAIPSSSIIEVRPDHIVVQNIEIVEKKKVSQSILDKIEEMPLNLPHLG